MIDGIMWVLMVFGALWLLFMIVLGAMTFGDWLWRRWAR